MSIDRPLDMLLGNKGKNVIVILTDGTQIAGELIAFDIYINLVLKVDSDYKFIRGDNVKLIS